DVSSVGSRVLVRACMRPQGFNSLESAWLGSDLDGAFAQFVKVPTSEVFAVKSSWSDAELATIPCAYGTAENMINRTGITRGTRVLVTGASGGVGSAAVQLASRRGGHVIGITTASKLEKVRSVGANEVIERNADLIQILGKKSIDVVVDNVAGAGFSTMLEILRRGGIYISSGA